MKKRIDATQIEKRFHEEQNESWLITTSICGTLLGFILLAMIVAAIVRYKKKQREPPKRSTQPREPTPEGSELTRIQISGPFIAEHPRRTTIDKRQLRDLPLPPKPPKPNSETIAVGAATRQTDTQHNNHLQVPKTSGRASPGPTATNGV